MPYISILSIISRIFLHCGQHKHCGVIIGSFKNTNAVLGSKKLDHIRNILGFEYDRRRVCLLFFAVTNSIGSPQAWQDEMR